MQITKLTHEKLLAAIDGARSDARMARDVAERAQIRANEAETELKKARAGSEFYSTQADDFRKRVAELTNMVTVRETAIVQVGLRLAAYGDPGLSLMVLP